MASQSSMPRHRRPSVTYFNDIAVGTQERTDAGLDYALVLWIALEVLADQCSPAWEREHRAVFLTIQSASELTCGLSQ